MIVTPGSAFGDLERAMCVWRWCIRFRLLRKQWRKSEKAEFWIKRISGSPMGGGAVDFVQDITEFIFVEHKPEKADIIFIPGGDRGELL